MDQDQKEATGTEQQPVVENTKEDIDAAKPVEQPAVEKPTVEESAIEQPTVEQPEKANKPKMSKKKKILISLLVVLILAIAGVLVWYFVFRTPAEPQNDQADFEITPEQISKFTLKGNELSDFDLAFLKLDENSENVIYSPLSIKYALGMLADGADGDSKTQINNLLGDYQPKAYLNSANRSFANGMFVREGSTFSDLIKDSYTDNLKTKYGASVIYDSFKSPDNANNWVSDQTLGIINNVFNEDNFNTEKDFALVNALAIDMKWNNQLQCTFGTYSRATSSPDKSGLSCKYYNMRYDHEDYSDFISLVNDNKKESFSKLLFSGEQEVPAAEIGASANRYDIVKELGENYIRETVQAEREKWLQEGNQDEANHPFSLDEYMKELAANYGKLDESTDFLFYDSETEKVFAKDLMEYDGVTLEYVGIMPKTEELGNYINNLSAEDATNIINNLKASSKIDSYKEGVVTKIHGSIPFFNYNYNMEKFKDNLKELGVTDVFDKELANLSGMVDLDKTDDNAYIMDTSHKADIDFSNDGIKAAAVTVMDGGLGSTYPGFDYKWEVPVEEIDLTFDKPFLFIIRDKASGEVWFTGAVYNI